jgi:hypothetical protein
MIKKEMIKVIQQHDAELFLQLKVDESVFGEDHTITKSSRTRWCGVNDLMEKLGIKPDNTLPENQEAIRLIIERNKNIAA